MAAKRLVRKFTDVVAEVELQLKAHYDVSEAELTAWRNRANALAHKFPHSTMVDISDLWIDYEVQRDVLHKHVINIMKKWDPRVCSPGSACRIAGDERVFLYDAQHRTLAAAILGYTEVPCAIVDTTDVNFASYAFELLNDTGVKRLNPGDLHRNALVRFKNGSRDIKNVRARTLQDQFDGNKIDLQDKGSRTSDNLRGDHDYFFSHFKYAYKGIELDETGTILGDILHAIKTVFPQQEEIDQGCFIGLYELQRLAGTTGTVTLPAGWMQDVLISAKAAFSGSHTIHAKAKIQWEYSHPGAGWNAPLAMSNFLRELHVVTNNTINLPYHGAASKTGIEDGNIAPGLFPKSKVA